MHSSDILNTLNFQLFTKIRHARGKGRDGLLEKIEICVDSLMSLRHPSPVHRYFRPQLPGKATAIVVETPRVLLGMRGGNGQGYSPAKVIIARSVCLLIAFDHSDKIMCHVVIGDQDPASTNGVDILGVLRFIQVVVIRVMIFRYSGTMVAKSHSADRTRIFSGSFGQRRCISAKKSQCRAICHFLVY